MADAFGFTCTCCGQRHDGFPDLAFPAPYYYEQLSDEQRTAIAIKTDDICSIADEDFFIRGLLLLPIIGRDEEFGLGVWVSLSQKNFTRYIELFKHPDPSGEDPYFGWFSNRVPGCPDTLSLKTNVHLQPYPKRPRIVLESTDHPLSVYQHRGIELDELQRIFEANLHGSAPNA